MRTILLTFLILSTSVEPLLAKGCIRGAVVGGVAGHFVGKGHGVAGAAIGCAVGHHEASKDESAQKTKQH
jgi:outer membrane lipoprotein SlyB